MFTLEHFIWLGISAVISAGMFFVYKKFKLSFDTVLNIMITVSILSEVTKIFCNMIETGYEGGMVLDPGDLPFHLCSMQIFLIFILKFFLKTDSAKEKMLAFMCPTMIIGAVCALLIPTVGTSFTKVQVYQFFFYHAFLIFFALYIIVEKFVKWNLASFIRNIGFLGMFTLLCMWINSTLSQSYEKVNFMYLVRPPMEDLPLLNLDNGWAVYFLTLAVLAVTLLAVFYLAVSIPDMIKKKNEKSTTA